MGKFKIRRKMEDRMVAGVCSAIASAIGIDPIWIRVIVVTAGILAFPWAFVGYVIAAIIIPKDESEECSSIRDYKKLYRVKEGRMIGGVCTGFEKYFDTDVVLVRLLFLFSFLIGVGFIIYPVLWFITPLYKPKESVIV